MYWTQLSLYLPYCPRDELTAEGPLTSPLPSGDGYELVDEFDVEEGEEERAGEEEEEEEGDPLESDVKHEVVDQETVEEVDQEINDALVNYFL